MQTNCVDRETAEVMVINFSSRLSELAELTLSDCSFRFR